MRNELTATIVANSGKLSKSTIIKALCTEGIVLFKENFFQSGNEAQTNSWRYSSGLEEHGYELDQNTYEVSWRELTKEQILSILKVGEIRCYVDTFGENAGKLSWIPFE